MGNKAMRRRLTIKQIKFNRYRKPRRWHGQFRKKSGIDEVRGSTRVNKSGNGRIAEARYLDLNNKRIGRMGGKGNRGNWKQTNEQKERGNETMRTVE